jgi:hypothetical protein
LRIIIWSGSRERTDVDDDDQEPLLLPAHLPTSERVLPHDLALAVPPPGSRDVFVERDASKSVSEPLDGRAFEDLGRRAGVGDRVKASIEDDGRVQVGVE